LLLFTISLFGLSFDFAYVVFVMLLLRKQLLTTSMVAIKIKETILVCLYRADKLFGLNTRNTLLHLEYIPF
jgi:hypothetical protein